MEAAKISENTATACITAPDIFLKLLRTPYVELNICHRFSFFATGCLSLSKEEYKYSVKGQMELINIPKN